MHAGTWDRPVRREYTARAYFFETSASTPPHLPPLSLPCSHRRLLSVDSVPVKVVAEIICVSESKSERDECGASVAQALVPTNLACLAPVRDLFVCENPTKGEKKGENRCPEEKKRFSECLQVRAWVREDPACVVIT